MSIALGEQPSTGIQRGRGGFMRNSADVPYVSDPTGATVKSGERKGEIKRLMYGSPSNRGKRIENTTNLVKWGERRVVLGMGLDPELVAMCQRLATLDVDSDEYKTAADSIIVRAKDVAKANLAADRGTHVHALTEDFDESRDWVLRAEAGEIVDLDRELQAALVAGWHRMLEREQLEVLAVEASCVDDTWRLAGTLDRIVRTGKPLRFALGRGELVEIPAGTVLVLDVKTSNKRLDSNGCVQYWNAFSIQIASYAQSVPYDTETETRGEWPWTIDQRHALIAHPDIDTAEWELIYCDLTAGREHGGACVVTANAWEARTDVFSVAQLDVPVDAAPISTGTTNSPAVEDPLRMAATAGDGTVRATSAAPAPFDDDFDAPMVPTVAPGQGHLPRSARAESLQWAGKPLPVPTPELTIVRDEGSFVHLDAAFNELEAEYARLDSDARNWIKRLTEEAMHAAVSFHSHGNRTERRWWIIKGLVSLGLSGFAEDEVLRALVAIAMESDAPLFAAIRPGYAVGALGAAEAQVFSNLVDDLNLGRLQGLIDDGGTFVLRRVA